MGHFLELCVDNRLSLIECEVVEYCVYQETASQWVLLTEAEVKERFVVIEERKKCIIESKLRAQLREEKRLKSEELLSKLAEARMQRKLQQQGLAVILLFSDILRQCSKVKFSHTTL